MRRFVCASRKRCAARKRRSKRSVASGIEQREIKPLGGVRGTAGLFVAVLAGLSSVSNVIRDEKKLWRIFREGLWLRTCRRFRAGP